MTATNQIDMFTKQRAGEYKLPEGAVVMHCRSCGQACIWTKTVHGKMVLLSLATVEERDGIRYALVHFSDCPQAKKWSKK